MTLQELLRANGLSEEVISAVEAGMKQNKLYITNEENLDIRYGKLKGDFDGLTAKHAEAQGLIEQLKQSTAGNEELQGKIGSYEQTIQVLQKELEKSKLDSAVKVALLEAKVSDIDYMAYKLREKGELALDENGKIKGWDDMITGLKTQFPNQFESAGQKKYEEHKLEQGEDNRNAITKEQFEKMGYNERLKIYQEQPEVYNELKK